MYQTMIHYSYHNDQFILYAVSLKISTVLFIMILQFYNYRSMKMAHFHLKKHGSSPILSAFPAQDFIQGSVR